MCKHSVRKHLAYNFNAPRVLLTSFLCAALTLSCHIHAQSGQIRDPTTPLGFTATATGVSGDVALQLNSVLISSQRKVAIINGASLREGQMVPGTSIKVARILPQKVIVQQDDKTWSVSLAKGVLHRR